MIEKLLKNQGYTIAKTAMKMFLKDDDRSLIAYIDDNGEPNSIVFKFDIRTRIKSLEDKIGSLSNENARLIRVIDELEKQNYQLRLNENE